MKGIGKKTLLDIKANYPTLEALIYDLKAGKHIPLRDDIVEILRKVLL